MLPWCTMVALTSPSINTITYPSCNARYLFVENPESMKTANSMVSISTGTNRSPGWVPYLHAFIASFNLLVSFSSCSLASDSLENA